MVLSNLTPTSTSHDRPAFDVFQGFALCAVLSSLETTGALDVLVRDGGWDGLAADGEELLATELLRYLTERGMLHRRDGRHELTPLGEAVRADIGYLVWLCGGYGVPLRSVGDLLTGALRYGGDTGRDGRGVAVGSAIVGARDLVPPARELLDGVRVGHVVDLGCGNARFLLSVCRAADAGGLGLDVNADACAEARREIDVAGVADRIMVRCADAGALDGIPELAHTDLVIAFFLLHEILADGRPALVGYLRNLAGRLPDGAHLLVAEVSPDPARPAGGHLFNPEFTLVHAMMRQRLMDESGWRETFAAGGFDLVRAVHPRMPGSLLMLARKGA
ncbi:class I SAM-dependent methyltransferase [Micromonospora echinospora]|uniref:class I SAM-dependent methyltransferase n=1 Tax=Micromonospora echinospora TaxID=1877 RepID=UPI0037B0312B